MSEKPTSVREKIDLASINRELTITAGFKSAARQTKEGIQVISGSAQMLVTGAKTAMEPARVEKFEAAMSRLGVSADQLPLIHNQILLQSYLAFFAMITGFSMAASYLSSGVMVAALLSLVVGLICLMHAIQSSLRCYQIRSKELGLLFSWLKNPAEWFGSRLNGLQAMSKSDPLRHPDVVKPMAAKSNILLLSNAVFMGLFVGSYYFELSSKWGIWSAIFLLAALYCFLRGASLSFEVFRRRTGLHCDLALWVLTPLDWIPSVIDERSESLRQFEPQKRVRVKGSEASNQEIQNVKGSAAND